MLETPVALGRYALVGRLASGGMGTVYRARLTGEGGFVRDFALKRLHPHFAEDSEAVGMFMDEARLAALVHHPNVVATLDVGREEGSGDLYVVMELVEGASLAELVIGARCLPPPVAVRIVLDILEGLAAAHGARDEEGHPLEIVHRDVSPANVLVGREGIAKLTDFGVAKARERLRTTVGVEVKGKLGYMPPEQLEGEAVDARADLFATGVVLWELLRGERLLLGNRPRLKELEAADAPPWFATGTGDAIDALLRRALSRAPEARHDSAKAMSAALREAAESVGGPGVADAKSVAAFVRAHAPKLRTDEAPGLDAPARELGADGVLPGTGTREPTDVVGLGAAWSVPAGDAVGPVSSVSSASSLSSSPLGASRTLPLAIAVPGLASAAPAPAPDTTVRLARTSPEAVRPPPRRRAWAVALAAAVVATAAAVVVGQAARRGVPAVPASPAATAALEAPPAALPYVPATGEEPEPPGAASDPADRLDPRLAPGAPSASGRGRAPSRRPRPRAAASSGPPASDDPFGGRH